MSYFYGTIDGSPKLQKTACGHKKQGIVTHAASYNGAIRTDVYYSEEHSADRYRVTLVDWPGKSTVKILAEGFLSDREIHIKKAA